MQVDLVIICRRSVIAVMTAVIAAVTVVADAELAFPAIAADVVRGQAVTQAPPLDPAALYARGQAYQTGEKAPIDFERAAGYYATAALLGYPPAQFRFAAQLIGGVGVDRDLRSAAKWLFVAAANRSDSKVAAAARDMLKTLESSITAEDLATAEGEARQFKPTSDPIGAVETLSPSVRRAVALANLDPPPTVFELQRHLGVRFCAPPTVEAETGGGYVVKGYREHFRGTDRPAVDAEWVKRRRVATALTPLAPAICDYSRFVESLPAKARTLDVQVEDAEGHDLAGVAKGTILSVTLPAQDFSGIVSVDYLEHTGAIHHLVTSVQGRRSVLRRNESLTLSGPWGRGASRKQGRTLPDMVIVTVSEVPLYDKARPDPDNAAGYRDLLRQRLGEEDVDTRIYYRILPALP
ncbi:MAG: sel1 repeat family protein [Alphaproteobacteria bacterium]|nr:sel1 repeat family protein [Alphaproteobacteria bacterium]MCB9928726.1 sel1 repeat family protein [Alphaproteobacteria bacterium]